MSSAATDLLPALRRYLAIGQGPFSEVLGVSRVQLNQAERGVRPLPVAGRLRLAAVLAALPPAVLTALALGTEPPTPPAPAPAPAPGPLAVRAQQLRRELHRLDAELAARREAARRGRARLALLQTPAAPDLLGPGARLLRLEASQWTDAEAQAVLRLLEARRAGLLHELSLLEA
ncbi:hypothetical protein [Hymenobacter sp. B81]|uniref:hypothetical protein n=1 Tax=Hymenobacter sp. B81 TaxID=3344878 RepID=UPI0037DC3857